MNNLTFGQALEALKQGKKVKRSIWGGHWFLAKKLQCTRMIDQDRHRTFKASMLIAVLKDTGEHVPAQPYQSDLLAEDWEIID